MERRHARSGYRHEETIGFQPRRTRGIDGDRERQGRCGPTGTSTRTRLYRDPASAIEWEPDDPRVAAVADRLVGLLEAAGPTEWEGHDAELTDELVELLDSVFLDSVPIAPRLTQLLEERGWRGWTRLERIPPG